MDTHINEADLTQAGVGLASPLRLPDEGMVYHRGAPPGAPPAGNAATDAEGSVPPPSITTRPRRSRKVLLAGVAAAAVIGMAGAGAYVFQDAIRAGDMRLVSRQHAHVPAALAGLFASPGQHKPGPALEVGAQPHPTQVASRPVGVAPMAKPTQPEAGRTASAPGNRGVAMAEFAALKPGNAAAPGLSEQTRAPSPATPDMPNTLTVLLPPSGRAPPETQVVIPPAVQQAPAPVTVVVAPQPAAVPVATPVLPASPVQAPAAASTRSSPDALTAITEVQASPMMPARQVEVTNMVKSLAAQLRDTKTEVAQLQKALAHLSVKVDTGNSDFEARLSLAEASAMVQSSARAGTKPDDAEPAPPAPGAVTPVRPLTGAARAPVVPAAVTALPVAPEKRSVKDYVVKGASPGLAVLSALNPTAGSASVIEVGVGDAVPGLGRVKRVYQRGTSWVVETDNGSIQP